MAVGVACLCPPEGWAGRLDSRTPTGEVMCRQRAWSPLGRGVTGGGRERKAGHTAKLGIYITPSLIGWIDTSQNILPQGPGLVCCLNRAEKARGGGGYWGEAMIFFYLYAHLGHLMRKTITWPIVQTRGYYRLCHIKVQSLFDKSSLYDCASQHYRVISQWEHTHTRDRESKRGKHWYWSLRERGIERGRCFLFLPRLIRGHQIDIKWRNQCLF